MAEGIKSLIMKTKDYRYVNVDYDDNLKYKINWIDSEEERISVLSDTISLTSGNDNIYQHYRSLDFWKKLYIEKDEENGEKNFKVDFKKAAHIAGDNTKSYLRYTRVSKIYDYLPQGSYLTINTPNSHWRLIKKDKFDEIISYFNEMISENN